MADAARGFLLETSDRRLFGEKNVTLNTPRRMTSRLRVIKARKLETTDEVPFFDFNFDLQFVYSFAADDWTAPASRFVFTLARFRPGRL